MCGSELHALPEGVQRGVLLLGNPITMLLGIPALLWCLVSGISQRIWVRLAMVAGYAAFTHHLGLYPHSGRVIPQIDCTPFKTSKSGVLFTPDTPLPDALLQAILAARQAEIAAGFGRKA